MRFQGDALYKANMFISFAAFIASILFAVFSGYVTAWVRVAVCLLTGVFMLISLFNMETAAEVERVQKKEME